MPHYNRAHAVQSSILSVVKQTYENWELIIVDDGSEDVALLKSFIASLGDERIRLICHSTNLNGAQARNTGINNATGQYLAFLDSDDLWQDDKLYVQLQHITQNNDKHVLYTQLRCYNSEKPSDITVKPENAIAEDESLGNYLFVHAGVMQTSSLFMHTSFAKGLLFNPELKRHQDYDFLLRAEQAGAKFTFIHETLVDYIWIASERITFKSISVERSLSWLEEYKGFLSPEARVGFLLKEVSNTALRTKKLHPLFAYARTHHTVSECMQITMGLVGAGWRLLLGKIKRTLA